MSIPLSIPIAIF